MLSQCAPAVDGAEHVRVVAVPAVYRQVDDAPADVARTLELPGTALHRGLLAVRVGADSARLRVGPVKHGRPQLRAVLEADEALEQVRVLGTEAVLLQFMFAGSAF
jgi:hypothetical protein